MRANVDTRHPMRSPHQKRLVELRLHTGATDISQCAAVVSPGDNKVATGECRDRRLNRCRTDKKLGANFSPGHIEYLRLDTAESDILIGPTDDEAAIPQRSD